MLCAGGRTRFSLVHFHYDHAHFRLGVHGKVFLHKRTLRNGQRVGVGAVIPPFLRKLLSQLRPAIQEADVADLFY
jgi:hypothetical protein